MDVGTSPGARSDPGPAALTAPSSGGSQLAGEATVFQDFRFSEREPMREDFKSFPDFLRPSGINMLEDDEARTSATNKRPEARLVRSTRKRKLVGDTAAENKRHKAVKQAAHQRLANDAFKGRAPQRAPVSSAIGHPRYLLRSQSPKMSTLTSQTDDSSPRILRWQALLSKVSEKVTPAAKPQYATSSSQHGAIEFFPNDGPNRGDLVEVSSHWEALLPKDNNYPASADGKHIGFLTCAPSKIIAEMRSGSYSDEDVTGILYTFMSELLHVNVNVKVWDKTHKLITKRTGFGWITGIDKDQISAATAYAIVIQFNGRWDGWDLFEFLLAKSPVEVLKEFVEHWDGYFIRYDMICTALTHVSRDVLEDDVPTKQFRCEAAGTLVVRLHRDMNAKDSVCGLQHMTEVFKERMQRYFVSVYTSVEDPVRRRAFTKQSAVISGIFMAGAIRYIQEVVREAEERREAIQAILNVALSFVGCIGHGADIVAGAISVLVNFAYKKLYTDNSGLMQRALQDMITEGIIWPLMNEGKLSFIPESFQPLDTELITTFVLYFNLALRSNHVMY